jgi:2-phosphosulfolactate phosphatase
MRIDTFLTVPEVDPAVVEGRTALVIDVIRATTTIVQAISNGARAVYPTESSEEAIKLASSLGRDEVLLCGERGGLRIDGFDLGNSPSEYEREVVEDQQLVMSTTNGTRAFVAAEHAERVVPVSFVNLTAAAESAVADGPENLVVICSGKENRFSLDDAVCAGYLIREIQKVSGVVPELGDAGRTTVELAQRFEPTEDFLKSTAAGRALVDVGLEADLAFCARMNLHRVVPEMQDRIIRLPATEE